MYALRTSSWPGPGSPTGRSSSPKLPGVGRPSGREARMTIRVVRGMGSTATGTSCNRQFGPYTEAASAGKDSYCQTDTS